MKLDIRSETMEWVCVHPLEDLNKEVFLIVFWCGRTINPDGLLIVCWDKKRKNLDYILPKDFNKSLQEFLKDKKKRKLKLAEILNAYSQYKYKHGITDDQRNISLKKHPEILELILKALPHTLPEGTNALSRRVPPHQREKAYNIAKFDIEKALRYGGGMWKEFNLDSVNKSLLKKYRKDPMFSRILEKKKGMSLGELLLWSMSGRKSHVIPMYQINDMTLTRMQSKSGFDPLRTIRGFLRFIGEAHTNQGGKKERSRLTLEVKNSSLNKLLEKYPRGDAGDQYIKEVCEDELGRKPRKAEFIQIKKLYINSIR